MRDVLKNLPRVVKRNYLRSALLLAALAVPCMLLLFGPMTAGGPRLWRALGPTVLAFAPLLITYLFAHRLNRRLHASLQRAGGRLCTSCGYDLRAAGDAGTCPECGGAFHTEGDRLRWAIAGFMWHEPAATRPRHLAVTSSQDKSGSDASGVAAGPRTDGR